MVKRILCKRIFPEIGPNDHSYALHKSPTPERMPEEITANVKSFIRFTYADGSSHDPIVGSGVIGSLNMEDIPKKDIFIRRAYVNELVYNNEEVKDKIFQSSEESTGSILSACEVDEIVTTKYFNNIRNCFCIRERRDAKSRHSLDADWRDEQVDLGISALQYDTILSHRLEKSEHTMKSAHSKMSYVQTLLKKEDDKVLECPVCYSELETSWKMMPCLHNMCSTCYRNFLKQLVIRHECVVCRARFSPSDVKHVIKDKPIAAPDVATTSKASAEPVEQYTIKGMQLTFKMAAVMRNIVSVLDEDPTNKIIVFSAMSSALEMLSHIMKSIDMQHTLFRSRTCDLEDLAQFKQNFDVKVLLLPLSFGANGLNLVEANHIFFMEPIPNASVFQQATGRVFRMGQSRATTIHHLITKNTIEETIHSIVTGTNETGLTFGSFKKIIGINQ